jgi:hypothetical protein
MLQLEQKAMLPLIAQHDLRHRAKVQVLMQRELPKLELALQLDLLE